MGSQEQTLTVNFLDGYVDKRTFCSQLGITERTADRWAVMRFGPVRTKAGRKVLYEKKSILAWLKSQEQATGTAA